MVEIDEKELSVLKAKAKKWEELEIEICKCYESDDSDVDLITIGEIAASACDML
jgi:hypothetical protein